IAPCLDSATTLSAVVDGQEILLSREKFRVRSDVFEATLPPDGLLDAGTYSPVVDDGYYVMLAPLPVGLHAIHFIGASSGCQFGVDVTYRLNVVPVSLK
ncbi:MAG TPA: hypothetical protein VGN65_04355, partial [Casimicrobiaceae bacterium]